MAFTVMLRGPTSCASDFVAPMMAAWQGAVQRDKPGLREKAEVEFALRELRRIDDDVDDARPVRVLDDVRYGDAGGEGGSEGDGHLDVAVFARGVVEGGLPLLQRCLNGLRV